MKNKKKLKFRKNLLLNNIVGFLRNWVLKGVKNIIII